MKLFIQCLTDYAKNKYNANNESRMERGDSGYDLFVSEDVEIPANKTIMIKFGIACCPKQNHGYYLYPRSSISKTNFRMANSVGIIDMGYRGEICAMIDNISAEDIILTQGTRLFQLCAPDLTTIEVEFVEELDESIRGIGGFGSTNNI